MSLENYIDRQLVQKLLIEKFIINYKKDGSRVRTKLYYEKRLKDFQNLWDEFEKGHKNILLLSLKEELESTHEYIKDDIFSVVQTFYLNNYTAIHERYVEEFASRIETNSNQSETRTESKDDYKSKPNSSIQLPKISLDKFNGDYSKWPTFHDLFNTMINQNESLSSVQKMQYLKLHLTGEAEQLLRHFQVTANNYLAAWELLVDRYDNKRVLVNTQLKILFNQNNVTSESAQGIRGILDTTFECLQALRNLKINTEQWDPIIVFMVVQRLPVESHRLWEQEMSKNTEISTLAQLKEFLESRFRALEACSVKSSYNKRSTYPNKPTQSFHVSDKIVCPICNDSHYIRKCFKFTSLSPEERVKLVKQNRVCYNCLTPGHMLKDCPSKHNCKHCDKRHHSLIHLKFNNMSNKNFNTNNQNSSSPDTSSTNHSSMSTHHVLNVESPIFIPHNNSDEQNEINSCTASRKNHHVLLATAMVNIIGPSGKEGMVRALIDQGSQASFVTEKIVQSYRLKKEHITATVQGIGRERIQTINSRVKVNVRLSSQNKELSFEPLVLKKLTNLLPTARIPPKAWKHIAGLNLADPQFYEPGHVDLLLGADVFGSIILEGLIKGEVGTPIAQKTVFGWILSGEVTNYSNMERVISNFHLCISLEEQLKTFWEVEEIQNQNMLTQEEKKCEEIYETSTTRRADGKYEIELPFETTTTSYLGQSRNIAVQQLYQLEYKFKSNIKLKKEYSTCIKEYLNLGHMCLVKPQELYTNINDTNSYHTCYLPHHGVIKESSTTTKLRVVFDASRATKSGTSLNKILLKGPTVQDDLLAVLIRWRKHQIAFTADIEKMYRQIWVKEPFTEYQRIVWRDDPSSPIQDYKLLTVTFGTKSAPYLATRTLKRLAQDEAHNYPIGCKIIEKDFYVDDLLSGANTVEEAFEAQKQIIHATKSAGFPLRKWMSNRTELLHSLPNEDCEKLLPSSNDGTETIRTLGICWDPKSDSCSYIIKLDEIPSIWTKRSILSQIAKLFDPMGWLAPVIVSAKIMMQKLWLSGLHWDDEVTSNLKMEWINYFQNLEKIRNVSIQRWINYSTSNEKIEIHAFADASMKAYAAVIYMCTTDNQGIRSSNIIISKTKVAPIKTLSVPRLELCAITLAAKLIKYVLDSLDISQSITLYGWTDSEITLAWLKSIPTKWTTFVANRVAHTHELIGKNIWSHVPTQQNPADAASRGMDPSELIKHKMWWHGPEWLVKSKDNWPKKRETETDAERRKIQVNFIQSTADHIENRFSSFTKLIRTLCYCNRFIYNTRNKTKKQTGYLKNYELKIAIQILIQRSQQRHFSNEIQSCINKEVIDKKSSLLKLNPFMDENGILRVGGRLRFSSLSFTEKHPAILSDKDILTKLLIERTHKESLHGGPQLMLFILRKEYWILNARNMIRHQIYKCIPCFKQKADVRTQLMGDLPKSRVQATRPFLHCGVDYCGPFELKTHRSRGAKRYKAYVALFICMSVKAIHLETVTNMSAEGFIAAFRRFCSRRGLCTDLYCDCGSNFVGANRILAQQKQFLFGDVKIEIAELIENAGVTFHFNPPASPHFGGLWEAGVRSTKYHMKRVLENNILTYEEFTTVLTQIEACLNSRPLCEMTNDPQDLSPLTPAHFLIGDSILAPPQQSVLDVKMNRLDRWQHLQYTLQSFWQRWNREYLSRLQQRPKWNQITENVKIDDLVIVKDENLPPCKWLMARILETHPGPDGLVRVVTIRTKNSILKRPVAKLCVLPSEKQIEKREHIHT